MVTVPRAVLLLTSALLVQGQRPFFAGSRPIGYPELENKTTTESGLADKFGEDTTTQRLPIEANGDRDLVDRLSKLPIDKQPFWLINWQALEAHREKPQTYPQRPSHFAEPSLPVPSNTNSQLNTSALSITSNTPSMPVQSHTPLQPVANDVPVQSNANEQLNKLPFLPFSSNTNSQFGNIPFLPAPSNTNTQFGNLPFQPIPSNLPSQPIPSNTDSQVGTLPFLPFPSRTNSQIPNTAATKTDIELDQDDSLTVIPKTHNAVKDISVTMANGTTEKPLTDAGNTTSSNVKKSSTEIVPILDAKIPKNSNKIDSLNSEEKNSNKTLTNTNKHD